MLNARTTREQFAQAVGFDLVALKSAFRQKYIPGDTFRDFFSSKTAIIFNAYETASGFQIVIHNAPLFRAQKHRRLTLQFNGEAWDIHTAGHTSPSRLEVTDIQHGHAVWSPEKLGENVRAWLRKELGSEAVYRDLMQAHYDLPKTPALQVA